jgi:hypothetical protein
VGSAAPLKRWEGAKWGHPSVPGHSFESCRARHASSEKSSNLIKLRSGPNLVELRGSCRRSPRSVIVSRRWKALSSRHVILGGTRRSPTPRDRQIRQVIGAAKPNARMLCRVACRHIGCRWLRLDHCMIRFHYGRSSKSPKAGLRLHEGHRDVLLRLCNSIAVGRAADMSSLRGSLVALGQTLFSANREPADRN